MERLLQAPHGDGARLPERTSARRSSPHFVAHFLGTTTEIVMPLTLLFSP
jgi:hypothetical protein